MKNKLLLILVSCFLFACEEDKAPLFDEKPGLYFANENVNENNSAIIQFNRQKIELNYDFTLGKAMRMSEWGTLQEVYIGDSLLYDTIKLDVYRSGKLEENLNSFNLKQIKLEAKDGEVLLEPFTIEFFNPYSFEKGKPKATVKVVFHRPAKRGEYKTTIGVDLSNADGFVNTINEFANYTVIANNSYTRPRGWNDETSIYGAFSEEKYAFYITVLGQLYQDWHEYIGDDYLPKLRAALQEYNATHDVSKDFSF